MNNFFDAKQWRRGICLLLGMGAAFVLQAQDTMQLRSNAHLGFLYPLSTNGRQAAEYANDFSFHALMGLSKEENAFVLSGVSTVIRDRAAGLQFAGVSNYVGNETNGIQFAGVYNHTGQQLRGLQFAGVTNFTRRMDGFQFAGVLNKAKDVNGSQFAGILNKAGKVKGVQFAGIINIADSSDYPVALLNFIKQGEKSIGIATDETFNLLASFRSGGRVLYGIVEIGYNLKSDGNLWALGGGVGAHIAVTEKFRMNAELKTLMLEDFHQGEYVKYSIHFLPAWKLSDRIEVFAGPSLNFADTDMPEGNALFRNPLWENEYGQGHARLWYVGASAGIQFILQ